MTEGRSSDEYYRLRDLLEASVDPQTATVSEIIALALANSHTLNTDRTVELLETGNARYPNEIRIRFWLAWALWAFDGRPQRLKRAFDIFTTVGSATSQWQAAGLVWSVTCGFEAGCLSVADAVRLLNRAIEVDDRLVQAHHWLAIIARAEGQQSDAQHHFEQAVALMARRDSSCGLEEEYWNYGITGRWGDPEQMRQDWKQGLPRFTTPGRG